MSLDPFIHPDDEIQALLQITGVQAWKLWPPGGDQGDVHLTLRSATTVHRLNIPRQAPVIDWRARIATLLDSARGVKP